jgi:hypothetical protein
MKINQNEAFKMASFAFSAEKETLQIDFLNFFLSFNALFAISQSS